MYAEIFYGGKIENKVSSSLAGLILARPIQPPGASSSIKRQLAGPFVLPILAGTLQLANSTYLPCRAPHVLALFGLGELWNLIPKLEVVENLLDIRRKTLEIRIEVGLQLRLARSIAQVAQDKG